MKRRNSVHPDLILYNGKMRSFAADGATFEALASAGGRIVATGASDEVRRLAGPDTEQIDLEGRTAIPGLTDTHVHLAEKGTAEMEFVDCRDFYTETYSIADILQTLAKRAAEAPKGSWIVAHGSPMQDFRLKEKRFPDKHDIDRAIPDHPVSISFGAHITIANSLALKLAKITRDSADPAGGPIRKDPPTGEPTGELHELNEPVLRCHTAGLRCCVHAIGDRAFDMALGAYENAIEKSPRKDHRHRIEHMGNWLASPERMQRMVHSGIIAIPNIAIGYYVGDAILDCVGEKRLTK